MWFDFWHGQVQGQWLEKKHTNSICEVAIKHIIKGCNSFFAIRNSWCVGCVGLIFDLKSLNCINHHYRSASNSNLWSLISNPPQIGRWKACLATNAVIDLPMGHSELIFVSGAWSLNLIFDLWILISRFRRRHHCRLCGVVMCATCSRFLSYLSAREWILIIVYLIIYLTIVWYILLHYL